MAFPAAPTESGGAKLHFLTTDGNAAAGWFGVDTGSTGTGANTVGFAGIATHVHDDAAGSPGGLSTTSVPMVLAGGVRDDALGGLSPAAGDAVYLLVDANGALWTHDDALDAALAGSELQVDVVASLPAGTNAIGKLAANTGVDIGDVDVTSLVPGVAATSLGKAEDAAHSSGDTGVQTLAVRKATPADLSGADGDYEPLQLDNGRLWASTLVTGDALTALQLIDNPVAVLGTATYTETSTSGQVVGVVRNDTLAALAGTDNEIAPLQVNASGALYAVLAAGTAEIGKLAAGTAAIGKLAANSGVDIGDVTLTAGTAAIGKLAANSGVDIGDVDVTSIVPGTAATNLGKAEDAAHGSGDVGVMSLAVRNDALAALGGADGDYAPFQVGEDGGLWTRPSAGPKGGCKMFTSVDLDESEEDPASSAVTIYGIYAWNATAAPLWLQMFNTNTVTVGTTAPTNNYLIPGNADSDGAGVVLPIPVCGLAYSTALTVAITTGSGTNNGAPGAGDAGIVILYQD